ncbi:MAG: response regulator [Pseudomonadota bacterium]
MADTRVFKILVVDDEPDAVRYLTALLEDNGFATLSASTELEAMERIHADHPDLVTLDITMPEQSGVKTYREIKTHPMLAMIPVIIVTGVAEELKHFISSRKQVPRPEGYLSKPVDGQAFLNTVRRLLQPAGTAY